LASVIELGRQRHESTVRSVDPSLYRQSLVYRVTETQAESTAAGLISAAAPATVTVNGITLYPYTLTMTREAAKSWVGEYVYRAFEYPQVGEIEIELDTDGGTARFTQARSHLGDYVASGVAPSFGGLLNVTENGVEGIDAEVAAFNFTYHATFTGAALTQAYLLTVAALTKTINSATWHGFAAGTVFFRGVGGRIRKSATEVTLAFRFRFEPIDSARTDANGISLPDRSGHDVLHYSSQHSIDAPSGRLTQKATAAHIDRVYEFSAFSAFGFSSSPWL